MTESEYYHIQNGVLKAYTGREESILVPEGIHTIGEGAFKGCVSLRKVILPPGLRRIQDGAFKGCRRLETVEIPQGVTGIGGYAFHRCHELERIFLPDSVEEAGACAFLYCDSLREVRMPGVKRLGNQAFLNDMQLERLEISRALEESCICDVFTGCGRVREISFADGERWVMPNVVEAAGEMELPPLVRRIVMDILRMMELDGRCMNRYLLNIKHVEVPDGIESLGRSCFFDMRGILSVKLPASLKEIGSRAFRNCIGLEKVSFESQDVLIHEDAFKNCTALRTVRMCDGREYTFAGLQGLQGEEAGPDGDCMPELIRRIHGQILGNFRISGTLLLKYLGEETRVVVPEGITRIAEEAFTGNEAVNRVILPDSVREIGAEAFRNCLVLQTIVLPRKLREIGAGAFENCVKLLRMQLPPEIGRIEARTFRRCQALQEVELPENLRAIEESAFYGCLALKKIEFPNSLECIGKMAFYRCDALKEIRLPAGVKYTGSLAFAKSGVRKARMSADGRNYGADVFGDCGKLKTLVLEEGVRHIPDKLAFGCAALERVVLPGTIESAGRHPWEGTAFLRSWLEEQAASMTGEQEAEGKTEENTEAAAGVRSIRVTEERSGTEEESTEKSSIGERNIEKKDAEKDDARKEAAGKAGMEEETSGRGIAAKDASKEGFIFWDGRNCEGVVRLSERVRIVAGGAFYGNDRVTEICLPENIRFVGPAAFKGCKNLRRVLWPSGVKRLEAEVFAGCARLEEVSLSEPANQISGCELEAKPHLECESSTGCLSEYEPAANPHSVSVSPAGRLLEYEPAVNSQSACQPSEGRLPSWQFIGDRSFYQCSRLCRVRLDETEYIGKEAFSGCTALEKSRVRPGVRIGERAFEDTDFPDRIAAEHGTGEFLVVGDVLVSGKNGSGELCLPEGITGIGPFAFAGNRDITGVKLPESLQWTGEGAFFGCTGLKQVMLNRGLRRIGARTFEKCAVLTEVEASPASGVLQIGALAFAGCVSLKRAVLPGVSILAERLFAGCPSLTECICEDARAVQPYCFSGCAKLEKFSFNRLSVVRAYAFEGCDGLKYAEFRDGVCLGEHALEDCGGLETVILSGERGEIRLREYALSGCTALRRVVYQGREWQLDSYRDIFAGRIPETVRLLFCSAFSCFGIEQEEILCSYRGAGRIVKIPRGIRRIKAEVFRNLTMLREVEIPESVEHIGARAFHGTAWMEAQQEKSPMVSVNGMLLDGSRCKGEVTVPADIRLVCGWAFANGLGIESIRFLFGRVQVEEYAFRNCIFLREMTLPDGSTVRFSGIEDRERELPPLAKQAAAESLNCFKTDEAGVLIACTGNISRLRLARGITAIGDGAFQEGNLLTEISFPDTVRRIGRSAFMGCKWLREVRQAWNVERIDALAFSNCGALERIELSEKLRQIGLRAFENCTSLEEILIPEGVEEIPERAFFRCHSLKRILLPSTIKRIGREAFGFCRGLEKIRLPEGVVVEERAFVGTAVQAENWQV